MPRARLLFGGAPAFAPRFSIRARHRGSSRRRDCGRIWYVGMRLARFARRIGLQNGPRRCRWMATLFARRALHFAGVVILLSAGLSAQAYRLPHTVLPIYYDISIRPDLSTKLFSGTETITAHLLRPAAAIELDALGLAFQSASVASRGTWQAAGVALDPQRQIATLELPAPVPAGPIKVHIAFSGRLDDLARGFYVAEADGREYAATQFEPADARRAFPCFDEPEYKAAFSITVVAPQHDQVISNGGLISSVPGPKPGMRTVRFAPSPRMATYLVAIAIGKFRCVRGGADGVPIRVCTPPEEISRADFALRAAEHYLRYYDAYFKLQYPFGKLDLIAIPGQRGAMENTAAIFFNTSMLLVSQRDATQTIAHEIAHQWFGDMVTMRWWNDIWLNEGLATWMARKALVAWVGARGNLQTIPALSAAGPWAGGAPAVRRFVLDPREALGDVESSYLKPAAVLRMVEAYEGASAFRKGIVLYLRKHEFGNATGPDFWSAEAGVSGLPISEVMDSFLDQSGTPIVAIETSCRNGTETLVLSQRRLAAAPGSPAAGVGQLWTIPVGLKLPEDHNGTRTRYLLLRRREQTFHWRGCAPWVFANSGGDGYYVSDYAGRELSRVARSAKEALTPAERAVLVANAWSMVQTGQEPAPVYMDLADSLRQDDSPVVWEELLTAATAIWDKLITAADRRSYESWVRNWLRPEATRLGWVPSPTESSAVRQLRISLLSSLGRLGKDPQTLQRARRLARQYLDNPSSLPPDIGRLSLSLAASGSGERLFRTFLSRAESAHSRGVYGEYWVTLGDFEEPALVHRALDLSVSRPPNPKYIFDLVQRTTRTESGLNATWDFAKSNWSALARIPGATAFMIREMGKFCDAEHEANIAHFVAQHPTPGSAEATDAALRSVRACIAFRSRQGPPLAAWLRVNPALIAPVVKRSRATRHPASASR